jgi:hypothetical protein
MDDGERTTKYGLPKKMVKDCIVGSAYTYKVHEGNNGIGRYCRIYYRYVLSKSTIHSK